MSEVDEAKSIALESGNNFHCKVVRFLQDNGWHTQISPYYMDSSTNKPREIDLIAERSWNYIDDFARFSGTVNIKLFIECKYIPQMNVFWFSPKDKFSAKEWVKNNTPLAHSDINDHHYVSTNPDVAKLFASKSKPLIENEVVYKALNQSLNAMVYLRDRDSIIPENLSGGRSILEKIEIPLIVCNSFENFFRVNIDDSIEPEAIQDSFQLEVNYAYVHRNGNNINEYFLIDLVDFNNFDKFLDVLQSDANCMLNAIHNRR